MSNEIKYEIINDKKTLVSIDKSITNLVIDSDTIDVLDDVFSNTSIEYAKIPSFLSIFIKNKNLKEVEIISGDVIPKFAFSSCINLSKVIISESIESIEDFAFSSCNLLHEINIPASVKIIGNNVFKNTSIEKASIPSIAIKEVSNKKLKEVNVISGDTIPASAFKNLCQLTKVTLSNSITTIKDSAFAGCKMLNEINLSNNILKIEDSAFSNSISLTNIIFPNSLISLGEKAFLNCKKLTNINLVNSISSIEKAAFMGCSALKKVELPDIEVLKAFCFAQCNSLEDVIIPKTIKTIEPLVFKDSKSLKNLYFKGDIKDSMEVYSENLNLFKANLYFYSENTPNKPGKYWYYLDGEIKLYDEIVDDTSLEYELINDNEYMVVGLGSVNSADITIPSTYNDKLVAKINDSAFSLDMFSNRNDDEKEILEHITKITIDDGIKIIGENAFSFLKNLNSIELPDSIEYIGASAFSYCINLHDPINIKKIKEINKYTFFKCENLCEIKIEKNVDSILDEAFNNCYNLKSISLSKSVKTIGLNVFKNTKIEDVFYNGSLVDYFSIDFKSIESNPIYNNAKLHISSSTIKTALKVPTSVSVIKKNAFVNLTTLKTITISKSITKIEENAFLGCTNITKIKYLGSKNDYDNIIIDDGNDSLLNSEVICSIKSIDEDISISSNESLVEVSENDNSESNVISEVVLSSDDEIKDITNEVNNKIYTKEEQQNIDAHTYIKKYQELARNVKNQRMVCEETPTDENINLLRKLEEEFDAFKQKSKNKDENTTQAEVDNTNTLETKDLRNINESNNLDVNTFEVFKDVIIPTNINEHDKLKSIVEELKELNNNSNIFDLTEEITSLENKLNYTLKTTKVSKKDKVNKDINDYKAIIDRHESEIISLKNTIKDIINNINSINAVINENNEKKKFPFLTNDRVFIDNNQFYDPVDPDVALLERIKGNYDVDPIITDVLSRYNDDDLLSYEVTFIGDNLNKALIGLLNDDFDSLIRYLGSIRTSYRKLMKIIFDEFSNIESRNKFGDHLNSFNFMGLINILKDKKNIDEYIVKRLQKFDNIVNIIAHYNDNVNNTKVVKATITRFKNLNFKEKEDIILSFIEFFDKITFTKKERNNINKRLKI